MTSPRSNALDYAKANNSRFLAELKEFLRIPSISTDPSHEADMVEAANWVGNQFRNLGLKKVEIFQTSGHPVVYGELTPAGQDAPTVLIYGHYDVQPAEPLELWTSDAFDPVQRGDNLFARGASDMKGQVVATIKGLESVLNAGELPINVKFLIEGEEEIGSPNLGEFISDHLDLLKCDFALNPDTGMIAPDLPTITYALRGLAYFEVRIDGPDHDLHSGIYGGVVHNPAQALCELIAGMHDKDGKITLPGFYDRVREIDHLEREQLSRLPMGEEFYLQKTGAPALWGEMDYSPVERVGARPTLEVNGIYSGFIGDGSKTVLPAWAMAKISTRLVPDQDPDEVHQQLVQYLENNAPNTITFKVTSLVGSPASISAQESTGVKAMQKAMEQVWNKKPLFRREGGSVPVVVLFMDLLKVDSVNCGFSLPDDNAHSPNEKLHLPTWNNGIETMINFIYNLAE
ncbi:MAG: dipeptidase [Anaerolineales bacterium]|jgi:acetylornithine deacetylase/succinyl-diaminopimelate desuccinylase-like protein